MSVAAKDLTKDYKYGFNDGDEFVFRARKGLSKEVVADISRRKGEPEWMLEFRLKALEHFLQRPMPTWGPDLSGLDFDDIYYYVRPAEEQGRTWDDVPEGIKRTFDRLGIPEAERKFLGGVSAQYESEVVYHSIRRDLEKLGVLFSDCDTGLREPPEIFRKYFGTVIPPNDNKFAALNSAVWSGGSFVYVPKGVRVEIPRTNRGVEGRELVVVGGDHGAEVLAEDLRVLAEPGVAVGEQHPQLLQVAADGVVDHLGLVLGRDPAQELALGLGDPQAVEGPLDPLRDVVPGPALLLGRAHVVIDVVEVEPREVRPPGGHGPLQEVLQRLEPELQHPLRLPLAPGDVGHHLTGEPLLGPEDELVAVVEAVLVVLGQVLGRN